jgi:hypothetical protein
MRCDYTPVFALSIWQCRAICMENPKGVGVYDLGRRMSDGLQST